MIWLAMDFSSQKLSGITAAYQVPLSTAASPSAHPQPTKKPHTSYEMAVQSSGHRCGIYD